jgi:YggT family protein
MTQVLALGRADAADYIITLMYVYLLLIFVGIVASWFPRIPYNPVLNSVLGFVRDVTDPYLNLFRRFLPIVRLGPAGLDLSPLVATFVLLIVGRLLANIVAGSPT